jgi:hypothetical protein
MSPDIYERQDPPVPTRGKSSAVSQRRNEYLRAIGAEPVPHHPHHPRKKHHRSFGQKIVFFGFGVLALLAALVIIGSVLLALHTGPVEKGSPARDRIRAVSE